MNDNDYARRQLELDKQYALSFDTPEAREWIKSLSLDDRRRLEAEGLLKPMIDRSGSTLRDEDASESTMSSEKPDFAAAIDREPIAPAGQLSASAAGDVLASFCARLRGCNNSAMVFDAVCYATGVLAIEGKTATELAVKHGVTKQAFSKIAVEWCEKFGLPPARAMKSKRARTAYRERAKRVHQRQQAQTPT